MNKILKIFLALVLTLSMMLEIIPVNTVHAEEEVPVLEAETTEPAQEQENEETEEPVVPVETGTEEEDPPVEPVENTDPAENETLVETETEEETDLPEKEPLLLNTDAFSEEYTVGNLKVAVSYEPGTVPEGTEVFVSEASEEALNAIREQYEDDAVFLAADISFVFEDEEIEPKDYSDKKVSVVFSCDGEDSPAEIVHLKETISEDGEIVYDFQTVAAVVTPVTETIQVPVYEKQEITEKRNVPYEYKWTETVKKYKEVDVYGDVEVEYEEEVPVFETREITEERTEYVTKTRQVEKTRTVKVKVDFVWWNPLTWLGYKYVTEKYYVTETYKEPVTVTVVVGTEEVQVGTETVKKTRTERQVIGKETVEDGSEEVVHTETRYREEEFGTGQYELVVTGYNEECVTVAQSISFEADDFSTFLVRWGNNNNNNVTIHHGVMMSGSFVEFGTSGLPNTSNTNYPTNLNWSSYNDDAYAVLIYDFPGYEYVETRYLTSANTNPTTGTSIWPALQKRNASGNSNDNWRYCLSTRTSWNRDGAADNGSHIYVIYREKAITTGSSGSGGGGDQPGPTPSTFEPDVGKNVSNQQEDGTYEIELGFVGNKDTSEVKTTARVIVVFDLSGSMEENMSGGTASATNPSRLSLAKDAVNALADTLLDLEDSQGNKLVEMGLVTFATDARIRTFGTSNVQFTSDYDTYSGVITNLPISSNDTVGTGVNQIGRGTNWEKGLDLANSIPTSQDGKTYIVFVSDGDPTYRVSRGNYDDSVITSEINTFARVVTPIFGAGYGAATITRCYSTAKESAKSIVDHNKTLYTVGLSSDATNMRSLAEYSGGTYKAGDNAEEFAQSLSDIAGAISSEIGLTDVVIDDGVTDMSQIETDSLIGTAGNFEYYQSYPLTENDDGSYSYTIGNNTYSVTQAQVEAGTDGTHRIYTRRNSAGLYIIYIEYPWSDAPEASITASNNVIWNTHDANDKLEDGVYYSVKFTVWPKQEAYDLIADLDNRIRKITDEDLTDGTKEQLRVLLNGTTYEYDSQTKKWTGGLTDSELQNMIDEAGTASYSMKTNTGLSATYKYGGVEGTSTYTNYTNGNMTLDVETFGVEKLWNNVLPRDSRTAKMLTNDEGYLVDKDGELILDNENNQPISYRDSIAKDYAVYYVDLIVTKTENGVAGNYQEVTVYSSDDWKLDNIFISLGVLSVSEDGTITVRETGHEYSVIEKPTDAYYWELEATTYRPMMVNKDVTMLEKVVEGDDDYDDAVAQVSELKSKKIGEIVYYNFEGSIYRAIPGSDALLKATNHRRSYLNLTKVVSEEDAPDALFEYEIKITIPGVKHSNEEGFNVDLDPVWFSVFADGQAYKELEVSDNVHAEMYADEPTGYFWVDSGETFTIKMKAGWNYRSSNLLTGTTYEITESEENMEPGFVFEKVEPSAVSWNVVDGQYVEYDVDYEADEIDDTTIKGTILDTNTAYTVTYTNNYLGVFYVYHSSDNTVERIPMAVNGEAYSDDNPFNIYALTKANTLYGGYYEDYAGKSNGYDSAKLEFDENNQGSDADGTAYSYQYIQESNKAAWKAADAYTVIGTAMVPVKDTTYFLKEVPEGYLSPYTHYTYYKESKKIGGMITVSGIDDLNYDQDNTGFEIVDLSNMKATIVESLKITPLNNSSSVTVLTAAKVYKPKGVLDGYLGYADITEYVKEDAKILVKQFWTTLDGIKVKGKKMRELDFGDCTISKLKKTDSACTD